MNVSGYGAINDEELANRGNSSVGGLAPTSTTSTLLGDFGPIQQIRDGAAAANKNGPNPHPPISELDQVPLMPLKALSAPKKQKGKGSFIYYIIYAMVNSIMCVPCLYGYAAVIFNNDAFQPHISALSKLVVWSSIVHQFSFMVFSTLPFSIGQVQDAGLIFLSSMANTIADSILEDGGTIEEVVSTTLVLLSMGTACLGLILVAMGKNGLADAVSYIPLPVVGGYLGFIGYFCVQQGVALCISESMMGLLDWTKFFHSRAFLLAIPGLLAGLALAWISRTVDSDAILPIAMVVLPAGFYIILFVFDISLEESREGGWVGEVAPPVPVTDLFELIDSGKVHWQLISSCMATWVGMVFVVSFSSCLDVAAISMDMGEALNVNMELITVGISNFLSGITVGFTGSYIFSQTIFTYRSRTNSRWVGFMVALSFIAVVVSTVNLLEIVPLFFLGSTLIFIGFDLVYEWVFEVRHKLLLTEYCVLLVTFIAIQFIGIDAGIFLGIIVAVCEYVVTTARISSVSRVAKRSRAVWKPDQWKTLQRHGYHIQNPKIMTLELKGTIFFGSALQVLGNIIDEIGIKASEDDMKEMSLQSPRIHRANSFSKIPSFSPRRASTDLRMMKKARIEQDSLPNYGKLKPETLVIQPLPRYVVLDLAFVPNVDASAARGCFLQLAKMCARHDMLLCVAGANARVDWMLRSHDIAYGVEEEKTVLSNLSERTSLKTDRVLIFTTLFEALEFCEEILISELDSGYGTQFPKPAQSGRATTRLLSMREGKMSLSSAFVRILGLDDGDAKLLEAFESEEKSFYDENSYHSGEVIFENETSADSFFVILSGAVALFRPDRSNSPTYILSGAGTVKGLTHSTIIGEAGTVLRAGSMFGFVDFILERPWSFSSVAAQDGTVVAKLHRKGLDELKTEPVLERILDKVLLKASILELANVSSP